MKNFVLLILLFISSLSSQKLTIAKFISTINQDFKIKNQYELIDYYEKSSMSTPFIDKIEFRTELEDFDKYEQKYSLRISPKGFGETASRAKVTQMTKVENIIEYEEYYNLALKERYSLILDYVETQNLINHYQELRKIYKDRITVFKKVIETSEECDMVMLITAEDKLFNLELELVKLENIFTGLSSKIHSLAEGEIDFRNLISINKIKQELKLLKKMPSFDNIKVKNKKLKAELAKSKYELELAKARDYLSFLELGYNTKDYNKSHQYKKAFSIGLGIKLPFINPDRDRINERKARYLEEKLKLESSLRENKEKILSSTRSLERYLKQYEILLKRKQSGNAVTSFKKYQEVDGANPITLLKLKESVLDNEILLVKIKKNIRSKYIEILDELGKLTQKPLQNYLLAKEEKFNE